MPLIIPANTISGGYEVANSLRFNDGSNDYLNRTFGSSGNTKKFTVSFWFKLGIVPDGTSMNTIGSGTDNTNDFMIGFSYDGARTTGIHILARNSGTKVIDVQTNRKFRDLSAWYHAVISIDTTQSTDSNRVKIYINGSQETSLLTSTYPSQNTDLRWNTANAHYIGTTRDNQTATNTYDGYMAEVVHINDQQLDPTSFGEFDEDSGIWKPIDVSGLTFGTNGFYLDFENSGSLGADVSGNGNNFTVNNLTSIDQTTDTCTNNFATGNPLINKGNPTYSNGNNTCSASGSSWKSGFSTIGASSGKWYAEFKWVSDSGSPQYNMFGITETDGLSNSGSTYAHDLSTSYLYENSGGVFSSGASLLTLNSYNTGDIIGVALDLDNNKLYFSKNGTWQNSGDPTSGATGTGALSINSGTYLIGCHIYSNGTSVVNLNYGNPPFSISSGNTDGNGYGNFEYSVPSEYYSLNSKNLAEYG